MNLRLAQMMVVDLMRYHQLTAQGWRFRFDHARRRMGLCSYRKRIISLSKPLTLLNSEDQILDTILHEIAHALTPKDHGHGNEWKIMARSLGAKPERCTQASEIVQVKSDWKGQCLDCNVEIFRSRKPGLNTMLHAHHTPCKWKANKGKVVWTHRGRPVLRQYPQPMADAAQRIE